MSATTSTTEKLIPTTGAGANLEKYIWTQKLSDVTVSIPVPVGTRGKDIACKITDKRISLRDELWTYQSLVLLLQHSSTIPSHFALQSQ